MVRDGCPSGSEDGRMTTALPERSGVEGILTRRDQAEASVFLPENLLREARRQLGLTDARVPAVCLLDPDGDIVRSLRERERARRSETWACYHSDLWETEIGDEALGIVGCAVGGPYAVLVAEQLFASGCELLISVTSAGQVAPDLTPPCFIVIERALRGEGTSGAYLPAGTWADADAEVARPPPRGSWRWRWKRRRCMRSGGRGGGQCSAWRM